jgi:hypothetical protein
VAVHSGATIPACWANDLIVRMCSGLSYSFSTLHRDDGNVRAAERSKFGTEESKVATDQREVTRGVGAEWLAARDDPVWLASVAYLSVCPRPDSDDHRDALGCAQAEECGDITIAGETGIVIGRGLVVVPEDVGDTTSTPPARRGSSASRQRSRGSRVKWISPLIGIQRRPLRSSERFVTTSAVP